MSTMRRSFPLLLVASLASAACVERPRDLTRAERSQLRAYVGEQAPRPSHPLGIRFGDLAEVIGYDVNAANWGPGGSITVTTYWRVLRDFDEDVRAFTHVCDETGHMHFGADDEGIVRRLYPAGLWKAGEYIRDVQTILLPAAYDHPEAAVYVGLYHRADGERVPVVRGPNDGQQRARILSVRTGASADSSRGIDRPRIAAKPVVGGINVDGHLDEPAWRTATSTSPFVETLTGAPTSLRANVRVLWDATTVYFGWEVQDSFLVSPFRQHDDHLWEKDCVEIFLDPGGDGLNYFELQVNPLGAVFDTRYESRRQPQPFGDVAFDARLRAGVFPHGTPNDELDDEGYSVEIAVPFAALAVGPTPTATPSAGTTWRLNFYVMDTMREGVRASAWSPPRVGDFHMPARFGELAFEAGP